MSSSTNDLSTPLLGKISQHERDIDEDDEEEGCMMCALKIVYDDEESEDCESSSNDGQSKFPRWFENVVITALLPVLLFMQFGMAFSRSPIDASTGLRWSLCNYCVVLFAITAFRYRQHIYVFKPPCSNFLILLPEIFMNIILILLLFDKIVSAFWLLLGSMHLMTVFVLENSIRFLVFTKSPSPSPSSTDEDDELDVSFFQGGRVRTTQIV
jgi:hypothetical protein